MKKTQILIVDDHPIFRKGLIHLINEEEDMEVVAEAEDVFSATQVIKNVLPDMVIVDITLKNTSGLELIKYINEHYKDLPVLVLSMHDENIYAERALKAGAKGYIMKHEMAGQVAEAIRHVLTGKLYISEKMNEKMLANIFSRPKDQEDLDRDPATILSDRELEIFQLIGKGFKRKYISEALNLNVNTIGTYRERIKEKLGFSSSGELITQAILWVKLNEEKQE